MFKDILDWITLLASVITIIAGLATLFAVWIAYKTWKNWKAQHVYAVQREKLIENEINIIALFHYQENQIKQAIDMQNIKLKNKRNLNDSEIEFYKEVMQYISQKQIEFEDKYGFCNLILERYDIQLSNELKFDLLEFRNTTDRWILSISNCKNTNDLSNEIDKYKTATKVEKNKILDDLAKFRISFLK